MPYFNQKNIGKKKGNEIEPKEEETLDNRKNAFDSATSM